MSLRAVSEKLGQQTEIMVEISTDIYDYLETVISRSDMVGTKLDNLNTTNDKILKSLQPSGDDPDAKRDQQSSGDELEAKRDQQVVNERMLTLMQQIATNTGGDGSGGGGKGGGMFSAALAGGLGFMAKGLGAGAALAGLGVGLGAFFSGLALADAAGQYLKADGSAIKKQIITLSEALSEAPKDGLMILGGLIGGSGAIGALIGTRSVAAGGGIAAFGLGLGGFFAGLAAGDKAMSWLNVDGTKLKSMMINLAEGLSAFSGGQLAGLGALLAAGGLFAALPGGAGLKALGKAAVGMSVIGLGIGGFFTGLAVGDKAMDWMNVDGSNLRAMMINLGEGLTGLTQPDYGKLLLFPAAAAAAALGVGILTGADVAGSVAGAFSNVAKFFSGDESSIYDRITEGLKQLETIDADKLQKLDPAAIAIGNMAAALNSMGDVDMGDVRKSVEGLADTLAFTIPMLSKATVGGTFEYGGGRFSKPTKLHFGVGLDGIPNETFAKINSVLSVNSASQQSAPTSSNTMSTLIRENNETKNSAPVVIMDNSQNSTVSGGGGGSSIITGNYSPFDTYDPYLVTRK